MWLVRVKAKTPESIPRLMPFYASCWPITTTKKRGHLMPKLSRRRFLQAAGGSAAGVALSANASDIHGEEKAVKFRLGIVTYNIAANWDLPTILKICKSVGVSPVELRTTHKHGVE